MRLAAAERLVGRFAGLGAEVAIVEGDPRARSFGERLRGLLDRVAPDGGLVVLGSGAAPGASASDLAPFVAAAASAERVALANNRYSADLVAIGCAGSIAAAIPDLPSDNALPRWLEEVAGYRVTDLRGRRRLQLDLDSPLDGVVLGLPEARIDATATVRETLARVRTVAHDRRAELVLAGRTSAATVRWAERRLPARVRALIEERGLRASSRLALGDVGAPPGRAPRSVVGLLLDRVGPESLGSILAELGDGALIDSRVLLAHHLGAGEEAWPAPEDRFASDLLLPGSDRRSVAPRAHSGRAQGADPDRARRPHAHRPRAAARAPGPRMSDIRVELRRDPPPDPASVGDDPELVAADPRRDRGPRADDVRAVHGARPVRAGSRLLPPTRRPHRAAMATS